MPRRAAIGKRFDRPVDVVGEIAQEGGLDPGRVGQCQFLAGDQTRQIQHAQQCDGPQTEMAFHGFGPHQNPATKVNWNSRGRPRVLCEGRYFSSVRFLPMRSTPIRRPFDRHV
ncbi:hypothetical protein D9M69_623730 [compost metagenome]